MDDGQLQEWVEQISLQAFGWPFRHRARFNRRLRATGGRYFTKSHDIEISWHQWETYGRDDVEKIIKHELCHYHLHLQRRGYQHRDADFKLLLKQVGGTRFCRALPQRKEPASYKYKLKCVACGTEYYRKRKMDVRKYSCGKCRGKLELYMLDFPKRS
ncbi:SprT family protein [Paenibacillus chitinolyticus]|uniref:SprT family protein n=1 Tax=Paenibacillus chitinolyticus TaxID=79263 RepID=A0A410WRZ4_9BACL|nr:SprT family protein [Paenibacillus chitinolyticus]MCY9592002.1 SprT family protein [Paenibacillus chitinolyticus]MCY9598098.1 SprT family protein [Paenibacillus chitinolyticus]QAV17101.1 SprT family protein [Paenibacillus chitinolyticus]